MIHIIESRVPASCKRRHTHPSVRTATSHHRACSLQVRRSIEWLGDKGEARRYAAALILRELAENAPAVFNVHVRAFIDAVWNGLRDPKQLVREASVTALRVGCSLMQIT